MKELFDKVSLSCSKLTTRSYSTSFSLGIRLLSRELRNPIYAVYGFVRLADEIVDSFHAYEKKELLDQFRNDTYEAIERGISLNPILNSFQEVVNYYHIDRELIDSFLRSMEMDLEENLYNQEKFKTYILGSAEVVGLMCLKIFVNGDHSQYQKLEQYAMALGSAFQKVNFIRDIKDDFEILGRSYFPEVDINKFDDFNKSKIEESIQQDFALALKGIKKLPQKAKFGVYLAYVYYYALFKKIQNTPSNHVLSRRIRIPNNKKYGILLTSYIKYKLNFI